MLFGNENASRARWFAPWLLALATACASATPAPKTAAKAPAKPSATPSAAQPAHQEPPPRPADAGAAAAYYTQQAPLLLNGDSAAIAATDFVRLRRGHLYANAATVPHELDQGLEAAMEKDDGDAVLDFSKRIIALDPTDIRAQLLAATVLKHAGAGSDAEPHAAIAKGLIESIGRSGDGKGQVSAWTVYAVKEEYHFLLALGLGVRGQKLVGAGPREFDVLSVEDMRSGASGQAYFDVTELFDEEARSAEPR